MSPKIVDIIKQMKLDIAGREGFTVPQEIGGGVGIRFTLIGEGPTVDVVINTDRNYRILDNAGETLHVGEWPDYVDMDEDVEDIDFSRLYAHILDHYEDYVHNGSMPRWDESAPRFLKKMRTK